MNIEPSQKIKSVQHLYEIYPSMPRYANDPEESEVVKTYDFILKRFQGFYSKQPTYFVKCGTSPLLFGDCHHYSGYPYVSFSSTQDIIVAVAKTSADTIRINNYQSAVYGQKILSSKVGDWKFDSKEGEEKFIHGFIKILGVVADQLSLKDLGGIDLLIYSGVIEDEFIGWKEAIYACFYLAVTSVITKNKSIDNKNVTQLMKRLSTPQDQIYLQPQMIHYRPGCFTLHQASNARDIALPQNLCLVIAHSLTPLPKKLTQGKRFNLRKCQILLALQYLKNSAGTTKQFSSLKQVQEFIGCSTEQLLKQVENIQEGKITSQQIEQFADKSLIDILKEVPYANNVIDQNKDYHPRERAIFFIKEELIVSKLTSENLVESIKQSYTNQIQLLGIGSEQIQKLIEASSPWALAHKIVGNGWGGNVLLVCQKAKATKLIEELINNFYLSEENKVLLSDDLQQYVHLVEKPGTGLAILDPESEIWY